MADSDAATMLDLNMSSCKMIVFAHHHRVLDGIQEFLCEKGIGFVRIDGKTLAKDRQLAVQLFRSSNEIKIAIIGITAGGVGLDFSSAQNVVFLELPQTPSIMLQAEDRAHRRGQTKAVNIYIFCAKDTTDESHWKNLNRRLHHVSSTTNGKYDAVHEIAVEGVSYLEPTKESCHNQVLQKTESGLHSAELELHSSRLPQDLQLSEAVHEEAPEMNDRYEERSVSDDSSAQADVLHFKAELVPELEVAKLHPSIEIVANLYDGGVRPPGTDAPNKPNEQCEENYQIGKVQEHVIDPQTIKIDGNSVQHIEADCCSNKVDWLRFEVSQYTGRIHLYSCISGRDSRPKPLFENFRPEDLESENFPSAINKDTVSESVKDNPAYRHALLEFVNEWNKLRPIEQKKLFGKPLQLPLSVELCYLSENISHNKGGLLKGGSKRRSTPLYEISLPLPSDAVWKKVHIRSGHKKMEKEYTQGWTLKDEPLCKLCQKPCTGRSAKEPEYFEDLFCNLGCFEEYRIRTSNGFLRQQLFQIEHGICTNCQLDCHQLVKRLKPLLLEKRLKYIEKVAPKLASRKTLLNKLVNDPTEGNAWHADHIIPVYRGGGECMLENMRTLCVACHSDVTMAQRAERQATRIKARKRLKVMLNNSDNLGNTEESITQVQDKECSEMLEKFEEELLVAVPGSAYAVSHNLDVSSKS